MMIRRSKNIIKNNSKKYNFRSLNFIGKKILVTGAGGSIGFELCKQIMKLSPKLLIAMDFGETELFYTEMRLLEENPRMDLVTKILDIKDRVGIKALLKKNKPDIIFHAAAYKHVCMMENNPREAVLNNILGTKNLIESAEKNEVKQFINISTDKASDPTCIMGATKRINEKIIYCNNSKQLNKINVRFGNILGSRGSVLPIFQQQIMQRGPITLTDKNMTRYFMTVEEAIYLLLQSARIGHSGKTCFFDMGEPIKIIDLADKLIEAYGLKINKDIKISIIGKKPGEKISEQLHSNTELIKKTAVKKIFEVKEQEIPDRNFMKKVGSLINFCLNHTDDNVIKEKVMELAK